jgi:hypothetical protein
MSATKFNQLSEKWQQVLVDSVLEAEALVQSSQRQRKMSVEQLVQTLVIGCLETEAVSLRLWSEVAADLGCTISASSLDERLTGRVVMLLHEVLQSSIQRQVNVSRLPIVQLQQFSRMILYDSTAITLPPILKETFHASRQTGMGHMKVQVGYDYLNAQLQCLSVHEGIEPDQHDAGLLAQAVANALLIFDLGYFDQHDLKFINDRGAYFVTRYQSQTGLYDRETDVAIDLLEQLQQTTADCFEGTYHLGRAAKSKTRIVARRVTVAAATEHRRQVKRRAQREGYTPSQRSLCLCDWEIIITNLPDDWTAQQVLDLYRVRWQIELIFKAWKSHLDLTAFGYWRAERVLCQLYATLIGAVLCHCTFATVRYTTTEASLFKAVRIIRRIIPTLLPIIRRNWWGIGVWTNRLRQALLTFAQQQNLETAPSSLHRLINWGLT